MQKKLLTSTIVFLLFSLVSVQASDPIKLKTQQLSKLGFSANSSEEKALLSFEVGTDFNSNYPNQFFGAFYNPYKNLSFGVKLINNSFDIREFSYTEYYYYSGRSNFVDSLVIAEESDNVTEFIFLLSSQFSTKPLFSFFSVGTEISTGYGVFSDYYSIGNNQFEKKSTGGFVAKIDFFADFRVWKFHLRPYIYNAVAFLNDQKELTRKSSEVYKFSNIGLTLRFDVNLEKW